MRRLHDKTHQRATLFTRTKHAHSGQLSETFHCVTSKVRIVFENCRASDLFDVIDGGGEPDGAGDIRRAGLESVRRFFENAFFQGNADDHLAAAMPWRHRIENFRARVERSNASRPTHFVSGEGEEVAAQLLDIERQMSRALRGIHEREHAGGARLSTKLGDWI